MAAYIAARNHIETSASLWRLSFHHISLHCEVVMPADACSTCRAIELGSKGAVET